MGKAEANDPGTTVVNELFKRIQIDEEWSIREERGFNWWPYTLAQRVWATPAADRMGVQMCQVHIETDLLKDVIDDEKAARVLAPFNNAATLSSCWVYEGRVRLHASVSASLDNLVAATDLAMHATNLQLAESYRLLEMLLDQVGGTPDCTVHPKTGARAIPDDMLNVGRLYTNGDTALAGRVGFEQFVAGPHRCWAAATASADCFMADCG